MFKYAFALMKTLQKRLREKKLRKNGLPRQKSLLEREDYPAIQKAAANDILSHVMKFMELEEIEVRLTALEVAQSRRMQ